MDQFLGASIEVIIYWSLLDTCSSHCRREREREKEIGERMRQDKAEHVVLEHFYCKHVLSKPPRILAWSVFTIYLCLAPRMKHLIDDFKDEQKRAETQDGVANLGSLRRHKRISELCTNKGKSSLTVLGT